MYCSVCRWQEKSQAYKPTVIATVAKVSHPVCSFGKSAYSSHFKHTAQRGVKNSVSKFSYMYHNCVTLLSTICFRLCFHCSATFFAKCQARICGIVIAPETPVRNVCASVAGRSCTLLPSGKLLSLLGSFSHGPIFPLLLQAFPYQLFKLFHT